jgi:hypothetical protein
MAFAQGRVVLQHLLRKKTLVVTSPGQSPAHDNGAPEGVVHDLAVLKLVLRHALLSDH